MKPDHKPIEHLNNWKKKIIHKLTYHDSTGEDPQLYWRRDAILSLNEERKVGILININNLIIRILFMPRPASEVIVVTPRCPVPLNFPLYPVVQGMNIH